MKLEALLKNTLKKVGPMDPVLELVHEKLGKAYLRAGNQDEAFRHSDMAKKFDLKKPSSKYRTHNELD